MGQQKDLVKALSGSVLVLGIIFIAANLRPAITSVGPVVGAVRNGLHLSNAAAGFITTLTLLSFALILAPKLANRLGQELALFLGMIVLLVGILIRS